MATQVDLEVWRGAARDLVFTVYDSAGAAEDVTGWAVSFIVRPSHDSSSAVFTATTANGAVELTTPTSGVITVSMTAAQTGGIKAASYRHTLARTDSGSEVVLSEGSFRLRANSVLGERP